MEKPIFKLVIKLLVLIWIMPLCIPSKLVSCRQFVFLTSFIMFWLLNSSVLPSRFLAYSLKFSNLTLLIIQLFLLFNQSFKIINSFFIFIIIIILWLLRIKFVQTLIKDSFNPLFLSLIPTPLINLGYREAGQIRNFFKNRFSPVG